jgi:hypothetical protein
MKSWYIGLPFRYCPALFLLTCYITPEKDLIHRDNQTEQNPRIMKEKPAGAEEEDFGTL